MPCRACVKAIKAPILDNHYLNVLERPNLRFIQDIAKQFPLGPESRVCWDLNILGTPATRKIMTSKHGRLEMIHQITWTPGLILFIPRLVLNPIHMVLPCSSMFYPFLPFYPLHPSCCVRFYYLLLTKLTNYCHIDISPRSQLRTYRWSRCLGICHPLFILFTKVCTVEQL